jgi:hypothetical protein
MIEARGVADRCRVISGSFFDSIPAGADAYVLSHVLHDWPEAKCETILRNVRAVASRAKLLVIEPVLTSGPESDEAKFLDLMAMSITGGKHRSADDFHALLGRCGFRVTRIVPASPGVSIVESEPV